jgi:hypothetical protein
MTQTAWTKYTPALLKLSGSSSPQLEEGPPCIAEYAAEPWVDSARLQRQVPKAPDVRHGNALGKAQCCRPRSLS